MALASLLVGPGLVSAHVAAAPGTGSPPTTASPHTDVSQGPDGDRGRDRPERAERFAAISINGVRPTVVTTTTGPTVVVEGTVANTGNRLLRSLSIRLQRGQPARRAADLRAELAADPATFEVNGDFHTIAETLAPGATTGFSLRLPLSGPGGLRISEPGVYPLLVNLNATPDYGAQARVADSRTLLPVLSLPPDAERARLFAEHPDAMPGLGPDGSVAANTSRPAAFTLLWPLAAPPQAVPGRVGAGTTDQIVLVNDNLSRSLSPGGRLHDLLKGLHPVITARNDDPRAAVRDSLCLAVDPDLLVTVSAMTRGYAVLSDPSATGGPTVAGTGQEAARTWLAELTKAAAGRCVVALPFAGVDLDGLQRVGNTSLTRLSLRGSADLVDSILGVRSVRDVAIPTAGVVTNGGADELVKAQISTALTAADAVAPQDRSDAAGRYSIRADRLRIATFDRPISAALGAAGSRPRDVVATPGAQRMVLSNESPVSRRQAALASLAFPSIAVPDVRFPARPGDPLPVSGRSSVIAPPSFWSVTPEDAVDLVATAGLLLRSGAATATPLPTVVAQTTTASRAAALTGAPIPGAVPSPQAATSINTSAGLTWQLQAALVNVPDGPATPERYMAPLRYDLIRSMPTPDDDSTSAIGRIREGRAVRVGAVADTLRRMRESVSILDPGGRYTQVSERSPLLLVTRNELALPIRVRIETTAPADFEIDDLGVIEIPARGTRQVQMPAQSKRSSSTSVTFTLVSASGVRLGAGPIRLSVNSNAYGKPLFVVTIVAAAILVLLVARRLWHRFRGTPDPADADRPEASAQDRFIAGRGYSGPQGESGHG